MVIKPNLSLHYTFLHHPDLTIRLTVHFFGVAFILHLPVCNLNESAFKNNTLFLNVLIPFYRVQVYLLLDLKDQLGPENLAVQELPNAKKERCFK